MCPKCVPKFGTREASADLDLVGRSGIRLQEVLANFLDHTSTRRTTRKAHLSVRRCGENQDTMADLPDPDTAMALPVDELAMRLLERLGDLGPPIGKRNVLGGQVREFFDPYASVPRPEVNHREWEQKMSEAFDWLTAEGLLVRDASQRSDEFVRISERGQQALETADPRHYIDVAKLLAVRLHPRIDSKVRQHFSSGDPDAAVFTATKAVEIAVRDAAHLGNDLYGTKLMAAAFKPGEGPLHDPDAPTGEQAGVLALYMGLVGALKNPSSHRQVDYDDPLEAVEAIYFADLLLRMLDRISTLSPDE